VPNIQKSFAESLEQSTHNRALVGRLCILLALTTLVLYLPITGHDFVKFDDDAHIYKNPHVLSGLTWAGVIWAFGTNYFGTWHPLTWISYMVDFQLYGLNPAGYHLTNAIFHAANALLVFLLLNRVTGAMWRSAFVAAVFACHPLRVESVAWAVERKDVLSTFFFLLAVLAYVEYVQVRSLFWNSLSEDKSSPSDQRSVRSGRQAAAYYVVALLFFTLALMSKAMVVTLPFVLLLLDYWPLRRFQHSKPGFRLTSIKGLIFEKIPFLVLAIAASAATFVASHEGGAMSSLEAIPVGERVVNAITGYLRYVALTFWPQNLSVMYPYQAQWSPVVVFGAVFLLAAWSTLSIVKARSRPYLVVGWCWFLGTLVPTIGFVQVGYQSIADRFTYIPSIGLLLMLIWSFRDLSDASDSLKKLRPWLGTALLLACLVATSLQIPYWQNSATLFTHAVRVSSNNYLMYEKLGEVFNEAGRSEEALHYYSESVRIRPEWAEGQYTFGTLLLKTGNVREAVRHLDAAVKRDPGYAQAYNNLLEGLVRLGDLEHGIQMLARSVQLKTDWSEAHYNLGTALLQAGIPAEARIELSEALRLQPAYPEAHMNLGVALRMQGELQQALSHFAEAVRLVPENPEARFKLGLALLDEDCFQDAAVQFSEGLHINPDDVKTHYRLAVTLVRLGQTQEAAVHYREAIRLAPDFTQARNELANLTTPN